LGVYYGLQGVEEKIVYGISNDNINNGDDPCIGVIPIIEGTPASAGHLATNTVKMASSPARHLAIDRTTTPAPNGYLTAEGAPAPAGYLATDAVMTAPAPNGYLAAEGAPASAGHLATDAEKMASSPARHLAIDRTTTPAPASYLATDAVMTTPAPANHYGNFAELTCMPFWRTPDKASKNGMTEYDYLNFLRYQYDDFDHIDKQDGYIPYLLRGFMYLPSIPNIDGLVEKDYLNYLRHNYNDCASIDMPKGISYDEYVPYLIRAYNHITWPSRTPITLASSASVPATTIASTPATLAATTDSIQYFICCVNEEIHYIPNTVLDDAPEYDIPDEVASIMYNYDYEEEPSDDYSEMVAGAWVNAGS